jgi:uridine phosphorylase
MHCKHTNWDLRKGKPYVISCSEKLEKSLKATKYIKELRQQLEILRSARSCYAFEYSRRGIEFKMDNFEFEETESIT